MQGCYAMALCGAPERGGQGERGTRLKRRSMSGRSDRVGCRRVSTTPSWTAREGGGSYARGGIENSGGRLSAKRDGEKMASKNN